jgi:hypothetical protein
MKRKGYD